MLPIKSVCSILSKIKLKVIFEENAVKKQGKESGEKDNKVKVLNKLVCKQSPSQLPNRMLKQPN